MTEPCVIQLAQSPAEIEVVRRLMREYADYLNASLGEEHICLQDYEGELASLPGVYAAPRGAILLAQVGAEPAGCVLLKPLMKLGTSDPEERACEMKRLWVRAQFRSRGIGLMLAERLIKHARGLGYNAMYLDTVPAAMRSANVIYKKLGFEAVERYNFSPVLGANPKVDVEFFRLPL